jgi:hypothetical protein
MPDELGDTLLDYTRSVRHEKHSAPRWAITFRRDGEYFRAIHGGRQLEMGQR